MTPEIDICTYLDNTVSSLTSGTNLFYGAVLAVDDNVPALAAFVLLTGGSRPVPLACSGGHYENEASIQIIVRGAAYTETIELARTIYDTLRNAAVPGYSTCQPLQPGPIFIGVDKDAHYNVSINYRILYYE